MRDSSNRALNFIRKFEPLLVFLVETRANEDCVNRFCAKLPNAWDWASILVDGYSGGIVVAWNKLIGLVLPTVISRRALHLVISPGFSSNWVISVIYNASHFQSQCSLWHELSKIFAINLPWLIVGDFNTITSREKHKCGLYAYYSCKAHYFLNFIEDNNLLDLQFSGPRFTWCNNQAGVSRRWDRLDRCLVNVA